MKGWRMSSDVGVATEGWRMSYDVGKARVATRLIKPGIFMCRSGDAKPELLDAPRPEAPKWSGSCSSR